MMGFIFVNLGDDWVTGRFAEKEAPGNRYLRALRLQRGEIGDVETVAASGRQRQVTGGFTPS
jgi:hypothetical protein